MIHFETSSPRSKCFVEDVLHGVIRAAFYFAHGFRYRVQEVRFSFHICLSLMPNKAPEHNGAPPFRFVASSVAWMLVVSFMVGCPRRGSALR
jgi:hypothetical protein